VAVGGTLVLAAKLLLEEGSERVENLDAGLKLSRVAFERLNERLRKLRVAERLQLPYMVAGRADIVCAGLLCLTHVMERARLAEVLVTDWGLRHGILRSWDRPSAPRT
jgi:exopolyphosphatase/pppGpp-phosphohydrolase